VPFLHYDVVKASIDEASTTKRQRRLRFPCVICDLTCGVDMIEFGQCAWWVHCQCIPLTQNQPLDVTLNRQYHVQMSQMLLWMELGLVNSDPGWSFVLRAGVDDAAGAVFLQTDKFTILFAELGL